MYHSTLNFLTSLFCLLCQVSRCKINVFTGCPETLVLDMSKLVWSVLTSVKPRDPLASEVTTFCIHCNTYLRKFELVLDFLKYDHLLLFLSIFPSLLQLYFVIWSGIK